MGVFQVFKIVQMVLNRAKYRKCELFLLHLWYPLSSRELWVCSWSNLGAFTWKKTPNSGHKRDRKARINCPTKIYTEWAGKENRFCYTWNLDFRIMFSCKCVSGYILSVIQSCQCSPQLILPVLLSGILFSQW